jgi:GPH family glycoside/pentoside/hexuronide:cation symporter
MKIMSDDRLPFKKKFLFGLSAIPDQMVYQFFQLFVFTYYFAVVQLGTIPLMIGFIIWSIWNSINDPLLGGLSERTRHRGKLGKRKFYLIITIIPLSLMMIFLFTVPFAASEQILQYIYFLFIIMLFEFFYTLWDVNVNALFPEMFPTESHRAQTNVFVKALTVLGIILASLPSLLFTPLVVPKGVTPTPALLNSIKTNYIIGGTMVAVITILTALPFLLKGIKEKEEDREIFEKRPSFYQSLKITIKNRTFLKFTFTNMLVWYVFNTLILILPLFAEWVLGVSEGYIITISLASALIVAALLLPLHKRLGKKLGMRNAFMLTLGIWIILLFLFVLIPLGNVIFGIIVTAVQGIALSGALFYVDIIHGDVIDEDALKFGVKRSASYYGVNAFIHRFSTIFAILTIGIVFQWTPWSSDYNPLIPPSEIEFPIKMIMSVFPAIGCALGILILSQFPLHGEKLIRMREELKKHPYLQ